MAILFSLQANSIGDESKGIIWKQEALNASETYSDCNTI